MAEDPARYRRQQGTLYSLLAPMALMAIVVWLVDYPALGYVGIIFALYVVLVLLAMPTAISLDDIHPGRWLLGALLAGLLGGAMWLGAPLKWLLVALLVLLLLRMWYVRQYHRKHGHAQAAELMRRGLLMALWSSISVWVALYNPY